MALSLGVSESDACAVFHFDHFGSHPIVVDVASFVCQKQFPTFNVNANASYL